MGRILRYVAGASLAALLLAAGGCSKKSDTDQKLAEMQKQLDETKKALEAAKAATQAPESAAPAPQPSPPNKQASASTKSGSGSKATDANKQAIANNKDAIATNKAGIAANQEAAAKAQATADEAKKAAVRPVHTLPAGYEIAVRTTGEISTKHATNGSQWEGTLEKPIEVDGYVVAPAGSTVEGVVSNSDPGGRVKGVASIAVRLSRILTPEGRAIPIRTSDYTATAKSSVKKDALKTGIASGIGAAIGAIAGGGKGAAIGAGAGAAGGVGMSMATRGEAAVIPAETVLTLALSAPITVEERKQR